MAISAMFMYISNDDDDECYTLSSFSLAINHNVICMNACMDVCMPNLHINNFYVGHCQHITSAHKTQGNNFTDMYRSW